MLAELVGSKSRARLIALLAVAVGRPVHVRQLVRFCGGSVSSVQRDIGRFEDSGLIETGLDAEGRREVTLARAHPFARPLEALVAADYRLQYEARAALLPWLAPDTVDVLGECVFSIVQGFEPIRIMLFGAHARGTARHSDALDVLVVLPRVQDKRRTMVEIRTAIGFKGLPVEVIPTDPEDVQEQLMLQSSTVRDALDEGIVVYERVS